LLLCWSIATAASGATPAKLAVSADGRFLAHADGKAFLWIGDTAWKLADTLGREDIRFYLDERQRSGFTVIQTAVFMGHRQPQPIGQTRNPANAYGHRPFSGGDEPDTARPLVVAGGDADVPNDYWDHLDFIVREVRQRGLQLALLPCWGSQHVNGRARGGKAVIFNEASARAYGVFLGARFRLEPHLIWVLGGDINPDDKSDQRAVYRAMAEGLVTGVTGESPAWNQPHPAWNRLLMTYHPIGPHSSSEFFHGDAWLDFHMIQTFKYRDRTVDLVARDVALRNPVRPVVMGEPAYEGDADDPYAATSSALDVRRQAWQSFLSGACGFTYGALKSGPHGPLYAFAPGWKECLKLPGAAQVAGPLRQVLAAHAWADWQPDTSVFADGAGAKELTFAAARASDGRTLLVYFPENAAKKITLTGLKSARCTATWINPQNSARTSAGEYETQSQQNFAPPVGWPDALLLLEAN